VSKRYYVITKEGSEVKYFRNSQV